MHIYDELTELLEEEIRKTIKQDTMTPQNLEGVYKAIDVIKDVETIKAMRESDHGYSGNYGMREDRSYARGRDTYGRYTSRHSEAGRMIEKLEMMSEMTSDPEIRQAIDQCITKLES